MGIPKKTLWKNRGGKFHFYCPQCRIPRVTRYHPNPWRVRSVVQVFVAALFFTLLTWSWFDWKGMVSFLPFWIVFETVYRTKMRIDLACVACGFDPYLYLNDISRARKEIEMHWRKKYAAKGQPYPADVLAQKQAPPDSAQSQ